MQHSSTGSFFKGLGSGMVAGAAAALVGRAVLTGRKNITKGSSKMARAVGDFVDGIQTLLH